MRKQEYCDKCGRKCIYKTDLADKYHQNPESYYDSYDTNTGKRLYIGWWECPLYKKVFIFDNGHKTREFGVDIFTK